MATVVATISLLAAGAAADDERTQQYRELLAGARSTHDADIRQCRRMQGPERTLCMAQARAVHRKATAEAVAYQRNTPQARVDARMAAADADFAVARVRCKASRGNARDVCMQEARAARVAAIAFSSSLGKIRHP